MKSIPFPEVNQRFAEHQEEFETLPAYVHHDGSVHMCFKLSEEEMKQVAEQGVIWLTVQANHKPLQPIGSSLLYPFMSDEQIAAEEAEKKANEAKQEEE